jgi:hypothetical protein
MSDPLTDPPPQTVPLAYDELPEGSDLRRVYDGSGGVTIAAPAGDLSPAVRRSASRAGIAAAALVSGGALLVGGLVVGTSRIDPSLRVAAALSLGVLGAGVFLLVWWVLYTARKYILSDLRQQSTILHADRGRLLVETSGPLGARSFELNAHDILSVEVLAQRLGSAASAGAIPRLRLRMRDGTDMPLLPGRHAAELHWVAATLSETTGVPTITDVSKRT